MAGAAAPAGQTSLRALAAAKPAAMNAAPLRGALPAPPPPPLPAALRQTPASSLAFQPPGQPPLYVTEAAREIATAPGLNKDAQRAVMAKWQSRAILPYAPQSPQTGTGLQAFNSYGKGAMMDPAGSIGGAVMPETGVKGFDQAERIYPSDPTALNTIMRGAGNATAMLLPALAGGPAAAGAVGAAMGIGQGRMEVARRRQRGEEISGTQEAVYAAGGALTEGVTEAVGGRLLRGVGKPLASVAANVVGNVAEESAAQVGQNVLARSVFDENKPAVLEGVGSAALGGLGGGIVGAPMAYANARAGQQAAPTPAAPAPAAAPAKSVFGQIAPAEAPTPRQTPDDVAAVRESRLRDLLAERQQRTLARKNPVAMAVEAAIDAEEPSLAAEATQTPPVQPTPQTGTQGAPRPRYEDRVAMAEEEGMVAERQAKRRELSKLSAMDLANRVKALGERPKSKRDNIERLLRGEAPQQQEQAAQQPQAEELQVGGEPVEQGAHGLVDQVSALVEPNGSLSRGGDYVNELMKGRSDAEVTDLLKWATNHPSPFIKRFAGGNVAAELRTRGVPVDEIAWQQKTLSPAQEKARGLMPGSLTGAPKGPVPPEAATPQAAFTVTPGTPPVKKKPVERARPPRTPFSKAMIERKLLEHHTQAGGGFTAQDDAEFNTVSSGDPFTFHNKLPGEIRRHIENNPAARRLFKVTTDRAKAGGEDALHQLGDNYWRHVDNLAGSDVKAAIESAKRSNDPAVQFWGAVRENLPPPKERKAQDAVDPSTLNVGQEFELNGHQFQVVEDEDGLRVLKDGDDYPETPVSALEGQEIPVDKGTLRQGEEPEVPDDPFGDLEPAAIEPSRQLSREADAPDVARVRGMVSDMLDGPLMGALEASDRTNVNFAWQRVERAITEARELGGSSQDQDVLQSDMETIARAYEKADARASGRNVARNTEDLPEAEVVKPAPSLPAPKQEQPAAPKKQPWEMTEGEYHAARGDSGNTPAGYSEGIHEQYVAQIKQAIIRHPEKVPDAVLKERYGKGETSIDNEWHRRVEKINEAARQKRIAAKAKQEPAYVAPEKAESELELDPNDKEGFKRFVGAQKERKERRRQFVLSKMKEGQGGEIETSYGKLVVHRNPGPDRAEFPWRVTRLLSDGRPSGHDVFRVYDDPNDTGPYYKSAIGEVTGEVKMPDGADPVVKLRDHVKTKQPDAAPNPAAFFDADSAGASKQGSNLFGGATFDGATGRQQGSMFHEPVAVDAPQRAAEDQRAAAKFDEAATPSMFGKPADVPTGGRQHTDASLADFKRRTDAEGEAYLKRSEALAEKQGPLPPLKDKRTKAATPGEPRQGEVGGMLSSNEVVLTATGRKTTPFPKVAVDTDRKAARTTKLADAWLMQNALDEARARGDEYNARQFERNLAKPSQSDKDSAELYLFDKESVRPVPRPMLKPFPKGLPNEEARPVPQDAPVQPGAEAGGEGRPRDQRESQARPAAGGQEEGRQEAPAKARNPVGDAEPGRTSIAAFHGSPHDFDQFTTQKMGTGEGAQAYGWGMYFAGRKEVAEHYKEALSRRYSKPFRLDGQPVTDTEVTVALTNTLKEAGVTPNHATDIAVGFTNDVVHGGMLPQESVRRIGETHKYRVEQKQTATYLTRDATAALRQFANSLDRNSPADDGRPRLSARPRGGWSAERKWTDAKRSAYWDVTGRLAWIDPKTPIREAMGKVRQQLIETAKVQTKWSARATKPEDRRHARKIAMDAMEGVRLIDSGDVIPFVREPAHKGKLYEVEIAPDEDEFLDWDKPLGEQSEKVQAALRKAAPGQQDNSAEIRKLKEQAGEVQAKLYAAIDSKNYNPELTRSLRAERDAIVAKAESLGASTYGSVDGPIINYQPLTGQQIYRQVSAKLADPNLRDEGWTSVVNTINDSMANDEKASRALRALGIRGVKYLDGSSRTAGDGSHNYVVFDDADVKVQAKYRMQRDRAEGTDRVAALRKAIPGADIRAGDGWVMVSLPNGKSFTVSLEDKIPLTPEQRVASMAFGTDPAVAMHPEAQIAGMWVDRQQVMRLAKVASQRTVDHETWHMARDLAGLTDADKAMLEKRFGGNEEAEAEAYARWDWRKPDTVFAKIRDFFARIYDALFKPERDVFRRVRSGEAFGSPATATAAGDGSRTSIETDPRRRGFIDPAPFRAVVEAGAAVGRFAKGPADWWSKPLVETIEGQAGERGKVLARRMRAAGDAARELLGRVSDQHQQYQDAVSGSPGKDFLARRRAVRELQEKVVPAGKSYGYGKMQLAVEGRTPLDDLSPEAREMVRLRRKLTEDVGKLAVEAGVQVVDPRTSEVRPFVPAKDGQRYLRSFTNEFHAIAKLPDGHKLKTALAEAVADANGIDTPVAMKQINDSAEGPLFKKNATETVRLLENFPAWLKNPDTGRWVEILNTDPAGSADAMVNNAARRIGFIKTFGQDLPGQNVTADIVEAFGAAGGERADAERAVRALNGVPIDHLSINKYPPGTTEYEVLKAIGSVYNVAKGAALTTAAVPNLLEPLTKTQALSGWRPWARAMLAVARHPLAARQLTASIGARTVDRMRWMTRPGRRAEDIAKAISDVLTLPMRAVNEWNELHAAQTGVELAKDIKAGKNPDAALVTLDVLGFSEEQAKRMVAGRGRESEYRAIATRFAERTQGSTSSPAERSRAANSKVWQLAVPFDAYAQMTINRTARVHSSWFRSMKSGDRGRMIAANGLLARYYFGHAAAGAGAALIYALMNGGEEGVEEKLAEAKDDPAQFIRDALQNSLVGGVAGRILNAANSPKSLKLVEIAQSMSMPAMMLQDAIEAVGETGRYKDMAPIERAGAFLKNRAPANKPVATAMAAFGLGDDDQGLDVARKGLYRWKADQPGLSHGRADFSPAEDAVQFRRAMRQVEQRMKMMDEKGAQLAVRRALKLDDDGPEAVAASIRGRKLLRGLKPPQHESLKKRIGPRAYERLVAHDDLLESWALSMRFESENLEGVHGRHGAGLLKQRKTADKIEAAYRPARDAMDAGDVGTARMIAEANRDTIRQKPVSDAREKYLANLKKAMKAVEGNPHLTPLQKRERLEKLDAILRDVLPPTPPARTARK